MLRRGLGRLGSRWGGEAGGVEYPGRPRACLPLAQIESDSLNSEKASFLRP